MHVLRLLIRRNCHYVILAICLTIITNLSQMIYMLYIGELVNKIEAGAAIETTFTCILCIFLASNAITSFLNQIISRYTSEKMAHSLRTGYMRNLLYNSVYAVKPNKHLNNSSHHLTIDTAQAMSVFQNELAFANTYLSNNFFEFTCLLLTGTIVFVFLIFQNFLLTLIILIPTVLILLYVKYSSKKLSGIVASTMNEKEKLNRIAFGLIHAFPAVKIYSGETFCQNSYSEKLDIWGKYAEHEGRMHAIYNSLSGILSRIPLLLVLFIGGYLVFWGRISLGTLIVFLNLQKSVTQTIMNLPSYLSKFKVFTVNLSRIEIV